MVSWRDEWRKNHAIKISTTGMSNRERKWWGRNYSQRSGKLVGMVISVEDDEYARPGEKLWKDLLETEIYDELCREKTCLLGYVRFREHKDGTSSMIECVSRSQTYDIESYLLACWKDHL